MPIIPADFADPRVTALIEHHQKTAHAATEICSAHALDLRGLQQPEVQVFAIWEDDQLLGVGAIKQLSANHFELKSMHTVERARGKGVAAQMLKHLLQAARASGGERVSLETGSMDYFAPARRLYLRHGFSECAPFGEYEVDPNSVFLTLRLRQ